MDPAFNEIQKFNKLWHYVIAGFPVLVIAFLLVMELLNKIPEKHNQNNIDPISGLVIGVALSIGFFIWFSLIKLKTSITHEGVFVNFSGIPFCKKKFAWEHIQSISVINYSPLSDYGGWGVRYSLTGNGWCYNVAGDYGIKLFTVNGKAFLIGTQQKEEAGKIITHYFKK
ncbi:MAG: hypothetical protein HY062_12185 [Bacteroidetes bacterium]|nr:hypothetical protein [Bacteroidota bacterium]